MGEKRMRIGRYLNTDEREIHSKKFNIFIGISFGNRYFTKENIKKYILWSLENTKDDVLVLIADKIHTLNYEVINGYNPERALQVALRKGSEIEGTVKKIVRGLPQEKQHLIKICKWEDARKSKYYKDKVKIVLNEFKKNSRFHDFIIKIVQDNLGDKAKNLEKEKLGKLVLYVLDELPILLNGVDFEGRIYDLHAYPGLSCLDNLLMGLQENKMFGVLAQKLELKHKIAVIEAYVV